MTIATVTRGIAGACFCVTASTLLLLAACGGSSLAPASPEFVDAEPSAAALALGSETSTSSRADALTQAATPLATSVIAGPIATETAALDAQVAAVVGLFEGAIKNQKPVQKSAVLHVWILDGGDGLTLRFTMKKAADTHFGWLGEAKAKGAADSAYQTVLTGSFTRDPTLATQGRGSGIVGIDFGAFGSVAAGTKAATLAQGQILLGFRHGAAGAHHRLLLKNYTSDPASAPPQTLHFEVVRTLATAQQPARAWMTGSTEADLSALLSALGLPGVDATRLETLHARVRRTAGVGGYASAAIYSGNLPAGTAYLVRECWNASQQVAWRRVWSCTYQEAVNDGQLDFGQGCSLSTDASLLNLGGSPASDTTANPGDASNQAPVKALCFADQGSTAQAALATSAAADLASESAVSAGATSTLAGLLGAGAESGNVSVTGAASAAPPAPWNMPAGDGVPAEAIGLATSALPPGAQMLSQADFAAAQAKADWQPLSLGTNDAQAAMSALQLKRDEAVIREAERAGGKSLMPPDLVAAPGDELLPDGNVVHHYTIGSQQRQELLLGATDAKHSLAGSLRSFGRRENQLRFYSETYKRLDPAAIKKAGLVDPKLVQQNPGQYTDAQVANLNLTLGNNMLLFHGGPPYFLGATPMRACGHDNGEGYGGDQAGNSSSCSFAANGIVNNYDFTGKPHVTCVKDQGPKRGACAAFSSIGAIEYAAHAASGVYENLSEQALWNRAKLVWARQDLGNSGYTGLDIFNHLAADNWLVPFENQWDFNPALVSTATYDKNHNVTAYFNICANYNEPCSNTTHEGQTYCISILGIVYCGYQPPNINSQNYGIRITVASQLWNPNNTLGSAALMSISAYYQNPIVWGFQETDDWYNYAPGGYVGYNPGSHLDGKHDALIVGFVTDAEVQATVTGAPLSVDGNGYFIVKNSHNNCFGDGGFVYVPFAFVQAHTTEAMVLHGIQ